MLLREFAEDADWVHLDIAGTSTASSSKGHLVKGATGVPTRTLAQLAMNLATERPIDRQMILSVRSNEKSRNGRHNRVLR